MYNYLLKIEYDGTNMLDGSIRKWIINSRKNRNSTKKIFKIKIRIIGAGRTDKGVHAVEQSANFLIEIKLKIKKDL